MKRDGYIAKIGMLTENRETRSPVKMSGTQETGARSPATDKGKTVAESQIVMARSMQPLDANVWGNVHGGAILRLVDEAGGAVGGDDGGYRRLGHAVAPRDVRGLKPFSPSTTVEVCTVALEF